MNIAANSMPLASAVDASMRAGDRLRRRLVRAGQEVWRALEAVGRARAHRHLMDFADRCEPLQPELAKELRAASRATVAG